MSPLTGSGARRIGTGVRAAGSPGRSILAAPLSGTCLLRQLCAIAPHSPRLSFSGCCPTLCCGFWAAEVDGVQKFLWRWLAGGAVGPSFLCRGRTYTSSMVYKVAVVELRSTTAFISGTRYSGDPRQSREQTALSAPTRDLRRLGWGSTHGIFCEGRHDGVDTSYRSIGAECRR
jgi:hypothetical protein